MSKRRKFNVLDHVLVPKHEIVPDSEVDSVLKQFKIDSKKHLPKILSTDPAIKAIRAKEGDVIRIYREEPTGKVIYYRLVV